MGVFLARQELRVVFDNFDLNKDGNISYSEFVNALRVSLKPLRPFLDFQINIACQIWRPNKS